MLLNLLSLYSVATVSKKIGPDWRMEEKMLKTGERYSIHFCKIKLFQSLPCPLCSLGGHESSDLDGCVPDYCHARRFYNHLYTWHCSGGRTSQGSGDRKQRITH